MSCGSCWALCTAVAWAEAPPQDPAPPEAAPSEPEAPPIVPPRALGALDVEYPEGAEGAAEVVVELSIDEQGAVQAATAIDAAPSFAAAAEQAALSWRFEPARRAGVAVPVRIRVLVTFTPPVYEELEPEEEAPPAPSEPGSATPVPPPAEGAEAAEAVEVVVRGERVVGVKKLAQADVRQLPGAFGDPYRAIEVLPGVTPIASGLPYFFIRGAPPGNVGYFFDGVPVPLLFHVAAGPGVLHPAFVESVDLYSGAYPVRFGRYAGGIVSGEAEDPEWRFRGEASIRIVDSGAFLEIPFADGRGSAMLAGRYSYTGLIVSLLAPDVTLGYWDYQSRISYAVTPEDRISVFAFGSHDYLSADNSAGQEQEVLDLTFHRIDTRYSKRIDADSELDLTLSLGLDRTGLGGDPDSDEEDAADLRSRMVGLRADFETQLYPSLRLRSGADVRLSRFDVNINPPEPGEDDDDDDDDDDPEDAPLTDRVLPPPGFPEVVLDPVLAASFEQGEATFNERFLQRDDLVSGMWVDAVIDAGSGVTLTPGFRFDVYDNGGEIAFAPEPRIAARFDLNPTVSLFHDLGIAHQPPSFAIPIPGLSGAGGSGLQRALQSSAGVETRLPEELTATVTLFQNVILNSTDIFGVGTLQEADASSNAFTTRTTAHSYGAEFLLQRSLSQRIGGLISYTLSRSTRSVTRLSGPSSFDRRHVLNGALAFNLGRRWRLGTRGMVYSGIPAQVYYPEATQNPPRTPPFYRFDWRLEKQWLIGTKGAWWALVFEVLNTTLNEEVLQSSCYAYGCVENTIGPVTIPSIGVEASF